MKMLRFFAVMVAILVIFSYFSYLVVLTLAHCNEPERVASAKEMLLEKLEKPQLGIFESFHDRARSVSLYYQIARSQGMNPKEEPQIRSLIQDHVEELLRALMGKVNFPHPDFHEWYVEYLKMYHRDDFEIFFSEEKLEEILFQKKLQRAKKMAAKLKETKLSRSWISLQYELEVMLRGDPRLAVEMAGQQ